MKIISGGQTGADQIALEVAYILGLETGGMAPKHYMTENGPNPALKNKYGLTEASSASYPYRTKHNVKNSDATLIFVKNKSKGTDLTIGYAQAARKPYLVVYTDAVNIKEIKKFSNVHILNVAGHRQSVGGAEYEKIVYKTLVKVLTKHAEQQKAHLE